MQTTKEFLMDSSNRMNSLIALGDVLGGRYRIEAVVGQGGMATVYRARHTTTNKPCALKLVHPHLATNRKLIDLFIKEAQIGACIGTNPHIVDVLDAGVDETRNVPFLAMELLNGETLEQYVETRGPLPTSLLRVILEQLADALHQAHVAGVIHRDLKPSNLFLTYSRDNVPHLKVLDFGIAKVLEAEAQKTATHLGTPAYAAPEQMGSTLRRMAACQHIKIATGVSPATDIWALGLIAYELITGLQTGQYWGVEALTELPTKIVLDEHEPASGRAAGRAHLLPHSFDAWFARCLNKDAHVRWPTARAAVAELLKLMPLPSPLEPSPKAANAPQKAPQLPEFAQATTLPAPASRSDSVDTRSAEPAKMPPTREVLERAGVEHKPRHILWVDDRPGNNFRERKILKASGFRFTLAYSTNEALNKLKSQAFAAIVSDMYRREGPREGIVLLDAIRARGDNTPFFVYAGLSTPQSKRETLKHGGQGSTNDFHELSMMIAQALSKQ